MKITGAESKYAAEQAVTEEEASSAAWLRN